MHTRMLLAGVMTAFVFSVSLLGCASPETESGSGTPSGPQTPPHEAAQAIPLPEYEIVTDETSDTPIKVQVEQHILVSGDISEESLEALLRQQFDSAMKRRGFRHHDTPTNVYIYIYETREKAQAGQGLWLAMLQMGPLEEGLPEITVRAEQIARIGQEQEEIFGLSEDQRKQVFREIVSVERRATDDAMKREPANIDKQFALERKLVEKYKVDLAKKYNVTREQLDEISVEGLEKQWVM